MVPENSLEHGPKIQRRREVAAVVKPGRIETRPIRHHPPAPHRSTEQECRRRRAVIRSFRAIGANGASKFADDQEDRVVPDRRKPHGKRRQRRVECGEERGKATFMPALV